MLECNFFGTPMYRRSKQEGTNSVYFFSGTKKTVSSESETVSSESKWKRKYCALKELFESRYTAVFNMNL